MRPLEADEMPGSSPHTRGLHEPLRLTQQPLRIIPAHAGFTGGDGGGGW